MNIMTTIKRLAVAVLAISSIHLTTYCQAQQLISKDSHLTFSGYGELYYIQDFTSLSNNHRPGFIYNHNRTREVNLNLAFIKASYETERVRANLALGIGTYMSANYSAEADGLKNVYEANIGLKLSSSHNLWLDVGIMPSHIGSESAVGKDNWTLTRGLAAENSPYFETGVKIGYTTKSEKWYLAALYLNGWQRIQRTNGNTTPAFGAQVIFKPSSAVTINYSAFAGNDQPDSLKRMRYFHNLYGIFQLSDKMGITAGVDFGLEQKGNRMAGFNKWVAPVFIVRYCPTDRLSIAARTEYYRGKEGVIIPTGLADGFETFGFSVGVDYSITPNLKWRLEGRSFRSKNNIFTGRNGSMTDKHTFLTTALAISF